MLVYLSWLTLFSSLPYSLLNFTLQNWMIDDGAGMATVSLMSLFNWPYILSPLLALFMEQCRQWVHERGFMVLGIVLVMLSCFFLAQLDTTLNDSFYPLVLIMGIAGAMFDAALGAYRSYFTKESLASVATSVNTSYRVGMIAFQAGLVILAEGMAWSSIFVVLTCLSVLFLLTVIALHVPVDSHRQPFRITALISWAKLQCQNGMVAFLFFFNAAYFWFHTVLLPYFRIVLQLDGAEVATALKGMGMLFTLLSCLLAGYLLQRYAFRRLAYLLFLQIFLLPVIMLVLHSGLPAQGIMYTVILLDACMHGILSTFIVALILALCPSDFRNVGLASMTSVALLSRPLLAPYSGWILEQNEWLFWCLALLLALVPLWQARRLRHVLEALK